MESINVITELKAIVMMQGDLAQDGMAPSPLNDKDYYLDYFMDCLEYPEALAQQMADMVLAFAPAYIASQGLTTIRIDTQVVQITTNTGERLSINWPSSEDSKVMEIFYSGLHTLYPNAIYL